MTFLVVSTNTADVSTYVEEEIRRVEELRAAGTITAVWLKSDRSGAVLVLECADRGEASAALGTMPMVQNNVTTVDLTEIVELDSVR